MGVLLAGEVFTSAHIAATALISGGLAFLASLLVVGRRGPALTESLMIGVLTTAAVFLWRKSANLPQLNTDGLHGFSANDWLAPTLTYLWLSVYRNLRPPRDPRSYGKAQALATIVALAVNVITI
jgi:hypothetical protein